MSIIKLFFIILVINHIFACMWIKLHFIQIKENSFSLTWLSPLDIENEGDWLNMWINAFYFSNVTMITVGYGDILPKTPAEKLFNVFNMLISCAVFGKKQFFY
jgi:hypothetical protein